MDQLQVKAETTYLEPDLVQNLQARLNRIEGHVRGVKRMLESQEECEKILVQLSAIKAAVSQVTIKLLEGHMETCVAECALAGDLEALEQLKRALALVLRNT
ncbi:MAG: metal-sensitive transcriptional regulator [Chloroflexi bacterium]|nr:metal-sensitive transcriptional regulator [Chloroflexota bacterium]